MKRRRECKTDYRKRLKLLKGGDVRLVIRRTLSNVHVQFIKYDKNGDKTLLEEMSKNLGKYGWLAHFNNLPAAYLIGLLSGLKARKLGINKAVLDTGLQISTKGNAIYATLMGVLDSGLKIPTDEKILPDKNRISGEHIANYAGLLSKERYERQFSSYFKRRLKPEDLPEHFEEVKKKIMDKFGILST